MKTKITRLDIIYGLIVVALMLASGELAFRELDPLPNDFNQITISEDKNMFIQHSKSLGALDFKVTYYTDKSNRQGKYSGQYHK